MNDRFALQPPTPFKSFWMGGFECADHLNAFGNRVDLCALTGHIEKVYEDYNNLAALGIYTVREGIRWSVVEKTPYVYDFDNAAILLKAAQHCGIQIVWDICHFGFPDDLTPLHPMFARRFAHLCRAFVVWLMEQNLQGKIIITPINEVSFLSWLGGDVRGTSPYTTGQGWDVKYHLMKAYIEGIERMKEVCPQVLIMPTEPLIHIAPQYPQNETSVMAAGAAHQAQYQAMDMLSGSMCPELRGRPDYIDIVGVNFYYNNQWIHETHEFIPWYEDTGFDARWRPLAAMLHEIYYRYARPVIISETSHPGNARALWMEKIITQCRIAIAENLPLQGCCIYPAIDRPDWDFPEVWHRSGIWDITDATTLNRIADEPLIALLKSVV